MVHQITLMEAYLIEALKGAGVSKEEMIQHVRKREADRLQRLAPSDFDYTLLYELEEVLEEILANGYQVKFLTFPGLQRLLLLQVEKEADFDYQVNGFTIEGLSLSEEEAKKVKTFLSSNWSLQELGESYSIAPTL